MDETKKSGAGDTMSFGKSEKGPSMRGTNKTIAATRKLLEAP